MPTIKELWDANPDKRPLKIRMIPRSGTLIPIKEMVKTPSGINCAFAVNNTSFDADHGGWELVEDKPSFTVDKELFDAMANMPKPDKYASMKLTREDYRYLFAAMFAASNNVSNWLDRDNDVIHNDPIEWADKLLEELEKSK